MYNSDRKTDWLQNHMKDKKYSIGKKLSNWNRKTRNADGREKIKCIYNKNKNFLHLHYTHMKCTQSNYRHALDVEGCQSDNQVLHAVKGVVPRSGAPRQCISPAHTLYRGLCWTWTGPADWGTAARGVIITTPPVSFIAEILFWTTSVIQQENIAQVCYLQIQRCFFSPACVWCSG